MEGPRYEGDRALLASAFDWARYGATDRLAELFESGASVELTNERGDTLLILAAYHCQPEVVRLLLSCSVALDRANDNGQTALGAAVFRQSSEIVDLLLEAGADPDGGARSARDVARFFTLTAMQDKLEGRPATSPALPPPG